jgi:hypothetical protein
MPPAESRRRNVKSRRTGRGDEMRGGQVDVSVVPAEETAAGIGTVFVDGAFPGGEKFTAVLDVQFMAACHGEVEAAGAKVPEPFVLGPGKLHAGKRAAAGAVAFFAAAVVIDRTVHEHAMLE